MPGGDRTGPLGQGPMTGGGFGYCNGNNVPGGWRNWGPGFAGAWGRGLGRGRGGGRGLNLRRRLHRRFAPDSYAPFPPHDHYYNNESEAEFLQREAQHLEASLEQIKERLTELENQKQENKNQE